jgi:hypothetical protein
LPHQGCSCSSREVSFDVGGGGEPFGGLQVRAKPGVQVEVRGACQGSEALQLEVAKGGRSKLLWKPIRHYFSRACQCLVPHDDLRATTKVHYILELSCTLEVHARRPVPWPVVLFLFLFSFSLGFGPFGWPSHLSTDSAPFPLGIELPIGSLKVNSLLFMIHCSEEQGRSGGAPADGSRGATR